MKSLLEIYKEIFLKYENDKLTLTEEMKMIYQAAQDYIEKLHNHDRWKYIIKMDIEDLKVSSQMQQNQLDSGHLDEKSIGIGKRYIFGISNFLTIIYHEMERYGLSLDDVQETTQHSIFPDTEAENNISLSTGENNNGGDNVKNTIPSDIMILFKNDKAKINEFKTKIGNLSNIIKDTAYYLDQDKGLNKQHGWQKAAFDYFVWPYYKDSGEKYENVLKRFTNKIEHKS